MMRQPENKTAWRSELPNGFLSDGLDFRLPLFAHPRQPEMPPKQKSSLKTNTRFQAAYPSRAVIQYSAPARASAQSTLSAPPKPACIRWQWLCCLACSLRG